MSSAALVVDDDLDLLSGLGEDDGYVIEALTGANFGGPQPFEVVLSSFLRDGAIVTRERDENRELTIPVRVRGADLMATALGEQRLASLTNRRTTLAYTPPDGFGPTTVFPVWTSSLLQPDFDDLAELRNERTYLWRFVCEPFSRSESLTTIGSDFVSDSVTISDDCESTTGWSVYGTGQTATISVDSTAGHFVTGTGAVKLVVEPYNFDSPDYVTAGLAYAQASVRKSGLSINASGGGYLVFSFRPEPGWTFSPNHVYLTTASGGREEGTVVAVTAQTNGFSRYAVTIPTHATITMLEVDGTLNKSPLPWGSQPANPGWWFDSIGIAAGATANQAARILDIGGSARGEGTLAVSAAVGLGDVLLYTAPDLGDGFRPDVRRYQTAGTSTADAAAINASYVPFNTGVFDVPTSTLRPGAYAVLARVRGASTTITPSLTAQTRLAGTAIGQTYTLSAGSVTLPNTTDYHVIRLGVLDLPPHRVDAAANAVVRISLTGASTTRCDELLIFPLEDAALTWVSCGSGSPSSTVASRLWIDGPSATLPHGQIVVGNDVDRADARYIQPSSKGRHLLYPGQMLAYLLTSASGGANLATSYFKRWHTWAAD